jgi:4-diphosphocytidyl-2-C-methyl-D-erythritol kinase
MQDNETIYTPAKLNLFLKITEKRDDGYHNIRSGITFINLFDVIEIKRSAKMKIMISIIRLFSNFKKQI